MLNKFLCITDCSTCFVEWLEIEYIMSSFLLQSFILKFEQFICFSKSFLVAEDKERLKLPQIIGNLL